MTELTPPADVPRRSVGWRALDAAASASWRLLLVAAAPAVAEIPKDEGFMRQPAAVQKSWPIRKSRLPCIR